MEPALAMAPEAGLPTTDEGERMLCWEMFNLFWDDCTSKGIPFDTVGTMSISAALFAIVARHGIDTTAAFLQDLAEIVRAGEFSLPIPPSH